jgi:hypothetical protein
MKDRGQGTEGRRQKTEGRRQKAGVRVREVRIAAMLYQNEGWKGGRMEEWKDGRMEG